MKKVWYVKIIVGGVLIILSSLCVLFFGKKEGSVSFNIEPSPHYRQKGAENSKVVIYEFSDLACPACEKAHFYLNDVVKYFPYVSVSFKHYPLTNIHPHAFKAAVWAECAGMRYSKFWEFVDILFSNRKRWSDNSDYEKLFEEYALTLSMDVKVIKECVERSQAIELVKKDMKEGDMVGVDATPTFFVNNKKAVGGFELVERLKEVIR